MQHVSERLGVHETMFNCHMQKLRDSRPPFLRAFKRDRQLFIDQRSHTLVVSQNLSGLGPVAGLVIWEFACDRINAECKQLVQFRFEWFQFAQFAAISTIRRAG